MSVTLQMVVIRVGGMVKTVKWLSMGHRAHSQKRHNGMPIAMPFCDVTYLESGHQLHSQNHCKNDHMFKMLV